MQRTAGMAAEHRRAHPRQASGRLPRELRQLLGVHPVHIGVARVELQKGFAHSGRAGQRERLKTMHAICRDGYASAPRNPMQPLRPHVHRRRLPRSPAWA